MFAVVNWQNSELKMKQEPKFPPRDQSSGKYQHLQTYCSLFLLIQMQGFMNMYEYAV